MSEGLIFPAGLYWSRTEAPSVFDAFAERHKGGCHEEATHTHSATVPAGDR
jgi:hypothetical protein